MEKAFVVLLKMQIELNGQFQYSARPGIEYLHIFQLGWMVFVGHIPFGRR
jgi:hypothetical protein